jgi:hypothetical protein
MQVTRVGRYPIDGSNQFESYCILTMNTKDGLKKYKNSVGDDSFWVNVKGFLPISNSSLKGITGSFHGTLYNVDDVQDVIYIDNGSFVFQKINFYTFNQCNEWDS